MTVFHLLRPKDWIKNILILGAVVFAGGLRDPILVGKALLCFLFFCWLASSGYVFNDWNDRDRDRLHPVKGLRPLASGLLSPQQALIAGLWMATMGMVGLLMLGPGVVMVGGIYLVLSMGYSLFFKHTPGLDALIVVALYLLRIEAGAQVLGGSASIWMFLCTAALTLPIALSKRQAEQGEKGIYGFLVKTPQVTTILFIIAFCLYALYSFSPDVRERAGGAGLVVSVPFVAWGLTILDQSGKQGKLADPVGLIFSSPPLLYAAIGWIFTCLLALYGPL